MAEQKGRGDRERTEGSAEVWGEVGGVCRQDDDGIMTGLSPSNGESKEGKEGGGRPKLVE